MARKTSLQAYVYLIPLAQYPFFKVGTSINVFNRMIGCGIADLADKSNITVVRCGEKILAEKLEKILHKSLHAYKCDSDAVPTELINGRTEFFRIEAWDLALKVISMYSHVDFHFDCAIEDKWDFDLEGHLKKEVEKLKLGQVAKHGTTKFIRRWNSLMFCGYWLRVLEHSSSLFLGLRYTKEINEIDGIHIRNLERVELVKNDPDLPDHEKLAWMNFLSQRLMVPRWVLVYDDPDCTLTERFAWNWKRGLDGVVREVPKAKRFYGEDALFSGSIRANGTTVLYINSDIFKKNSGIDRLLSYLQQHNPGFPNES